MAVRTRVVVAALVIAALATLAGFAYVWWSITRPGGGTPRNASVILEPYRTNVSWPVALAFTPDGRLLFAERFTGAIRIIRNDTVMPNPFFTITGVATGAEQGLLGLAIDPDFPTAPYVYAYHTFSNLSTREVYNRIVRIRASGDSGGSPAVLVDRIPAAAVHDGGVIAFGPDGKLYAVVGDATNPASAQDLGSPNGKVLRMNPDGGPPSDNPFVNTPGANPLVYTYGHRNMFGIAWHPATGRAYVTENGPTCNDEVNLLIAGRNFGWGPSETCSVPPPAPQNTNQDGPSPVLPLTWYASVFAPTNAAFYTGSLLPQSGNDLIFGDWIGHRLHDLRLDPAGTSVVNDSILLTASEAILDVEMAPSGKLYVTTPSAIYQVVAAPATAMADALPGLLSDFRAGSPLAGPTEGIRLTVQDPASERNKGVRGEILRLPS